ncbi:MAG: hypothetical protein ACQETI_02675 [Halobacteriota archaeon]
MDNDGDDRVHLDGDGGPVEDTVRVYLDGRHGNIRLGGAGSDGDVLVMDTDGDDRIHLDGEGGPVADTVRVYLDGWHGNIRLGGDGSDGDVLLREESGNQTVHLDASVGNATLGGGGTDGDLLVRDGDGVSRIHLDGERGPVGETVRVYLDGNDGTVRAGGGGANGDLTVADAEGTTRGRVTAAGGSTDDAASDGIRYTVDAADGSVRVGGDGVDGNLDVADLLDETRIRIGDYRTPDDMAASIDDPATRVRISTWGDIELGGDGEAGSIAVENDDGEETITADGEYATVSVGHAGEDGESGRIVVRDGFGQAGIALDGDRVGVGAADPDAFRPKNRIELEGADSKIELRDGAWTKRVRAHGDLGQLAVADDAGDETVLLDGQAGDITVGSIQSLVDTIDDLTQRVSALEAQLSAAQSSGD